MSVHSIAAPIGVLIGDPNGIGPELAVRVALQAAREGRVLRLIGDAGVIDHARQTLIRTGLEDAHHALDIHDVAALGAGAHSPGRVDAAAGAATVAYLREGVRLHQAGQLAALLAMPHHETAIARAGIAFSGYAGMLAQLTGTPADQVYLMLVAEGLRVIHVTVHQGLIEAIRGLRVERILGAAQAADRLCRQLGVASPRIALCGINPHAGEGGLFGDEDERLTRPAAQQLRAQGLDVADPLGADTLFSMRRHDAYVAMYHDQGHVPVKLLAPNQATAFSVGTPIAFASVAHGSGHDIAGQGRADPRAALNSLALLRRLVSPDAP